MPCSSATSTKTILTPPKHTSPPTLYWSHSRLTEIEVRRNLARLLDGDQLSDAKRQLAQDLDAFALVNLDADTCTQAAHIAETTLCRSLDALHLAAAWRAGQNTTVLTFDLRRAATARSLGLAVLGA